MSTLSLDQLLIVTCDAHRWHFRIQCLSIERYLLDRCRISIVINETDPTAWMAWFDAEIRPHMAAHQVRVYTWEQFFSAADYSVLLQNSDGWLRQQIFKLLFSAKTSVPYLVLDSKNWFMAPTRHGDMRKVMRPPLPTTGYEDLIEQTAKRFGLTGNETPCTPTTPFEFEPRIIEQMIDSCGGPHAFIDWFKTLRPTSEFIVYDLFCMSIGIDRSVTDWWWRNAEFWPKRYGIGRDMLDIHSLEEVFADPKIHGLTIHHSLISEEMVAAIESLIMARMSASD